MKTFELVRRGRKMEVTAVKGLMHNQPTTKGHISWTQNHYHNSVTWYVATNANGSRIEILYHSKVTKDMKQWLQKELAKMFIEGNEQ